MDSDSPDLCSWCHKDLRNVPTAAGRVITTKGPTGKKPVRQPVQKSVPPPPGPTKTPSPQPKTNGVAPPAAKAPPPPKPTDTVAPQLGTFQAQKSKYYGDKVYDPVSGAHYDADSGKAEEKLSEDKIIVEDVNMTRQVSINVGLLVVITGIAAGIVSAAPQSYLIVLGLASLLAGMIMPLLRTVPFGSDDSGDIALAIGLILILGPFAGALAYGVVGMMKGDVNPAIAGIFISYLVIRIGVDIGAGKPVAELFSKMLPDLNVANFAARWMPLAAVIGWYAADPFKKHDE
jgi:hypothetical protein